ncbi:hypothetical protein CARUB_v10007445mg [Capsella rubella]|uniref:Uncharacterized protein n=1 Tax=Capsella rubella TaxID=81985 RepID=R0FAR6_9BRAS|nr:hypothetical protein CARUB_v10007445mg [Capsella rubella]
MNRLIFFVLVIFVYFGVNEACKLNEIVFKNELGAGKRFEYQCHDGKTNSGVKYLNNNANSGIRFKDTGKQTSLWKCNLKHGVTVKYYYNVEAYLPTINYPRCGQLREYTARPDGVYFRKDNYPPVKLYSWLTQK